MTSTSSKSSTVYCGELCKNNKSNATEINLLNRNLRDIEANITIGYEKFVKDPETLSPRILDLLHLAAHIFCADRMISRGTRDSVNFDSWARVIEFHIPVLDIEFWSNSNLLQSLSECLQYMTGDRKYNFHFEQAKMNHIEPRTKQLSLFTNQSQFVHNTGDADVMLLSGGLDSLAGAIEHLNEEPHRNLIAINHKSNNQVIKTQTAIINELNLIYGNRVYKYGFECHNKSILKSVEETQRSRMFLFSAIAYAICECFGKSYFYVYENGITSINLPIQGDIMNARASRTTHPKTIGLLKKFFRFFDSNFDILTPYYSKTKEDIFKIFDKYGQKNLISSAVSCSSTRTPHGSAPHCGSCSQCIDRRFAAFASGLDDTDAPYSTDFITRIPDKNTNQLIYNILRLASAEKLKSPHDLYINYLDEMQDVINFWHCDNPEDSLLEIHDLYARFGDSVLRASKSMRAKFEDLTSPTPDNSFLSMLSSRDYLKTPTLIRVEEIDQVLRNQIPQIFSTGNLKDETDFSNKVKSLLEAAGGSFTREYPVLKFGITSYRADISTDNLIIESKYIRANSTPSVASSGIAEDITKVPNEHGLLFVVYDPERRIIHDDEFINAFQGKRADCFIRIYR
jgi:hypothetical protein